MDVMAIAKKIRNKNVNISQGATPMNDLLLTLNNHMIVLQTIATLMTGIAIKCTVNTHLERAKRMNIKSIIAQTVDAMNSLLPLHLIFEIIKPLWHPYGMRKNALASIATAKTMIRENVPISCAQHAMARAT